MRERAIKRILDITDKYSRQELVALSYDVKKILL